MKLKEQINDKRPVTKGRAQGITKQALHQIKLKSGVKKKKKKKLKSK